MNRHILKFLCILAAVLIWIQVASNRQQLVSVSLPLDLQGVPAGVTLAGNDWPETVEVSATVTKLQTFLHRYLGREPGKVVVDLSTVEASGLWQRDLTTNDVRSSLNGVSIVAPKRLTLFLDHLISVTAQVRPVIVGEIPAGRLLIGEVTIEPSSVVVTGPSRFLTEPLELETGPFNLARIHSTQDIRRQVLLSGEHLSAEPSEVVFQANVVESGRRTFDHVPVVPLVDAGRIVDVFPPVASVELIGPGQQIEVLPVAQISVTLSLTGLELGSHTLTPDVLLPASYALVQIDPGQFLVVIGADTTGDTDTESESQE